MTDQQRAAERVFFVFDVESVGLHGEGYAYGYVVVDSKGNELASGREAVDPADVNGTTDGREWMKENCPSVAVTKRNLAALHSQFVCDWIHWKVRGAVMVADCPWPVEARFLIACELGFDGPYPLIDVGSVVLAAGGNPVGEFDRLPNELPKHDPLCDARQSARLLLQHLDATRDDVAAVDEAWLDEVFDVRSRYQVTAFSSCWRLGDYRGNNHKLQIRLHRDSDTGRIGYCRLETRDGVSVCDISIRDQVRSLLKGININISAGA